MRQALESMASGGTERATDRRTPARRLIAELRPFQSRIVAALGLIVLSAGAQAVGPLIIGRAIDRAHCPVGVGNVLTYPAHGRVRVVRVEALPARRGPAPEARECYTELA